MRILAMTGTYFLGRRPRVTDCLVYPNFDPTPPPLGNSSEPATLSHDDALSKSTRILQHSNRLPTSAVDRTVRALIQTSMRLPCPLFDSGIARNFQRTIIRVSHIPKAVISVYRTIVLSLRKSIQKAEK